MLTPNDIAFVIDRAPRGVLARLGSPRVAAEARVPGHPTAPKPIDGSITPTTIGAPSMLGDTSVTTRTAECWLMTDNHGQAFDGYRHSQRWRCAS